MSEVLLVVTGQPRSGKDEICKHWAEVYDVGVVDYGQMIRDWANQEGFPIACRQDSARARNIMIRKNPDVFLEATFDAPKEVVAVNGLRVVREARALRQGPRTKILALQCDLWRRFQRHLHDPNNFGKPGSTLLEFYEQERPEYRNDDDDGIATLTVMEMADTTIHTGVSKPLMLRRADTFLEAQLDLVA